MRHVSNLQQLEILLPCSFEDEETEGYVRRICKHVKSPIPTVVRVRAAYDIGVDDAEFWEKPTPCSEGDAEGAICEALRKL